MADNGRKLARCPFYRSEGKGQISCEGLDAKSTMILSYPRNAAGKRERIRTYCEGDWELCAIARMLLREKYRD